LAAVPMWSRQSGRPGRYLAAVLILLAAAGLPILLTTWGATGGLPTGFTHPPAASIWNGPLALPIGRLLGTTCGLIVLSGLGLAAVVRSLAELTVDVVSG